MPYDTSPATAPLRPFAGRDIIIPTSAPDHGATVMAILGGLSAGAVHTRQQSGAERRQHDLEAFGQAYVALVEQRFPQYYRRTV